MYGVCVEREGVDPAAISLARWYQGWSRRCPSWSGGLWEGCCCWSCCCCCGWRSERRELHCHCYSPVCQERPGRAERSCTAGIGSAGGRDPQTPRLPPPPSPCYSADRPRDQRKKTNFLFSCHSSTRILIRSFERSSLPDDSLLVKTRKSSNLFKTERSNRDSSHLWCMQLTVLLGHRDIF